MQPEFTAVGARAIQVLEAWQGAYAAIQGVGISTEAPNAKIPGVSVSDINKRVTGALSAITRLNGANPENLELIAYRLPQLNVSVDAIETQAKAVFGALEAWQGATSTDQNGQLQLRVQHAEKGASNYDLGSPLVAVSQQLQPLLDALPYIAQVIGDDEVSVFAGLARAAEQAVVQAKTAASGSEKELTSCKSISKKIETTAENIEQTKKQIQDLLAVSTSQKVAVDENSAEVTQKLAQVREVSKDSDTLQQRVAGFSSQFEAFDAQMKARLESFSEFEISVQVAQRINDEREKKIAELIDKADTMIRGATTAGLSKSLEDARNLYEKRLQRTQWFFLASVTFLLICSLPIAAQLIPGPWQRFFAPLQTGNIDSPVLWLSGIGKLMLIIPGTWATAFFASNYAELFHLSREYAHKAALAKAIDGFKREAPKYQEEIVGSVFMEIQENPGSRKAPSAAIPQNPVSKKFLEKVLDAIKLVKTGS
jgi:hypothetical protein